MGKTISALSIWLGLTSIAYAKGADYNGPFTTQVLYDLCSHTDNISRAKCDMYVQGIVYGLTIERSVEDQGMQICVPNIDSEAARVLILKFIGGATGGNPSANKDGGDWMAFMALAAGHVCKK